MNRRILTVIGAPIFGAVLMSVGLCAALAGAEAQTGQLPQQVIDMVVASIDGEPLTLSDLKRFMQESGEKVPEDLLADRDAAKKAVNALVSERLLQKEGDALGIAVDDSQVAAYLEEIKKQNNTDDAGLIGALQVRGLTLEDYKKQVRSDILKTRIIASQVRAKVNITDDDVERYVNEHPGISPASGHVHLLQIYLRAPGGEEAGRNEAEKQLEVLRDKLAEEELKTPDEWAAAGGALFTDLGFIDPESLRPELKEAVLRLGEDEISNVLATDSGFYLLMVAERAGEEMKISSADRERIRRELYQQELKKRFEDFSQKELPGKYEVEYKL